METSVQVIRLFAELPMLMNTHFNLSLIFLIIEFLLQSDFPIATVHVVTIQGSYGSWKTWKVMKLKYFSFQAWKVMELNCRSWKVMENYSYVWYVNYCRSGSKDKIKCRRVMSENTPKTRTILTIFETGS